MQLYNTNHTPLVSVLVLISPVMCCVMSVRCVYMLSVVEFGLRVM